jgi:hypothetical protein
MNSGSQIHVIEVMNPMQQVFVNLNLVSGLKRMKMVEVIHTGKGRTTSWMVNNSIPFLKELNPRVTDWQMIRPLLDIWIYYRARNKNMIMEF